jgi:hypothetical protein
VSFEIYGRLVVLEDYAIRVVSEFRVEIGIARNATSVSVSIVEYR